jgi:RecB family endonuclease NucS
VRVGASRYDAAMRLVIARCSVDYAGRLSTHLPPAVRLLIVKADGSVLVHTDDGGYKPLNWMSAPCTLVEEPALEVQDGEEPEQVWRITNRSGETMTITVSEVLHDSAHQLGPDPGLVKDGVEKQLQELLSERCHVVRPDLQLVRREYPTDIGPVDLLCRDNAGTFVAVEIKRRAEIDGVEQLSRYLARLRPTLGTVAGVLVALEFKPQARVLAAERSIECVQVDYDELRGVESDLLRLF